MPKLKQMKERFKEIFAKHLLNYYKVHECVQNITEEDIIEEINEDTNEYDAIWNAIEELINEIEESKKPNIQKV